MVVVVCVEATTITQQQHHKLDKLLRAYKKNNKQVCVRLVKYLLLSSAAPLEGAKRSILLLSIDHKTKRFYFSLI